MTSVSTAPVTSLISIPPVNSKARVSELMQNLQHNILKGDNLEDILAFVTDCTKAFIPAYIPIIEKRKDMAFTPENKDWQRIVRGRYVEFILSCDRGMRFDLASNMVNPQSVFNCMPPGASWEYENQPVVGSDEAMLKEVLKNPRVWV